MSEIGKFSKLDIVGGVAILTMSRPERKNALHPAAHDELSQCFDALAENQAVRAIILSGAGADAFCAGYDLRDNLETGVLRLPETGFGGLTSRTDYPLPIIAAVNGVALGGGFELALACDLIIAAAHARFALPEPKVGWVAGGGGLQRLPRAIGTKQAMSMILTGRMVGADEGKALGFVNEVVPAADLMPCAIRWAEQIITCAPMAIRCSKHVAYASMDQPDFATAINAATYPLIGAMLASDDALEGKRAFAEKRAPKWTGR